MTYQWKTGFYKTSAQIAGEELERISALPSGLTAQAVVDESRPMVAPLHNEFDWNDETAAEKYRQHQARKLIGNLVIVTEQSSEPAECTAVRAFVKTETEYKNILVALRNQKDAEFVFQTALRELLSFKQKYAALTAFNNLFAEIDNLQNQVEEE